MIQLHEPLRYIINNIHLYIQQGHQYIDVLSLLPLLKQGYATETSITTFFNFYIYLYPQDVMCTNDIFNKAFGEIPSKNSKTTFENMLTVFPEFDKKQYDGNVLYELIYFNYDIIDTYEYENDIYKEVEIIKELNTFNNADIYFHHMKDNCLLLEDIILNVYNDYLFLNEQFNFYKSVIRLDFFKVINHKHLIDLECYHLAIKSGQSFMIDIIKKYLLKKLWYEKLFYEKYLHQDVHLYTKRLIYKSFLS